MLLPFLSSFGLTQKEADLYDTLLRKGELPIGELAKKMPYKRATVYKSLAALEKKGLVSRFTRGNKLCVKPQEPARLLTLADEDIQQKQRARADLVNTLPALTSSYILSVEKPVVSTFEGVAGLKEIYEDTLREGKPIFALVLPVDMDPQLLQYIRRSYRMRRVKAGIHASVIAASNEYAKEYASSDAEYLRTTRLVPFEKFPFEHEIDIYGDKVAIINYRKGDALIGIVIHHPRIARTMKAWFDLAWEGAQKSG